MFTNLRIGARLVALTVGSILALLVIGGIGVRATGSLADMLERTETEAQNPIIVLAEINEQMRESFQQLYAASLHNPILSASAHHDHPVGMHLDAVRAAIAKVEDLRADYRGSAAGRLFPGQATAFSGAWAALVRDGLEPALALAERDSVDGYQDVGVFLTTTTLPLFRDAKARAADLLTAHEALSEEIHHAAEEQYTFSTRTIVLGGLAVTALVLVGTLAIARGITRPIGAMTAAMHDLAAGDASVVVPATERTDEVGEMAAAVQVFKDDMIKTEALRAEQLREHEARARRAQAIERLTGDFEAAVGTALQTVGAAAGQLEATAGSMSATATQASQQAGSVAAAAEQASANVQTVASSAEELAASIQEISRQVGQSAEIAARAVERADRTHEQITGLAAAADKIGAVVNLITDIAEQTNLLALNATIEAARAGDAGKGFAVVANEVKSLATQTARATDEIGKQIGDVQRETREAVEAIEDISGVIRQINEISANIASAVEEQGAATSEIARNVEEAAQGTENVTTNISGVDQAAARTGAAANEVLGASQDLSRQARDLQGMVHTFLDGVRAA